MTVYGIVIASHVAEIAEGTKKLVEQVASNVPVTIAGGLPDGGIGTSIETIQSAIENNPADEILAFYDIGSAKMNLEVCCELVDKKVQIFDCPIVEGTYSAAALAEVGVSIDEIQKQLQALVIK